jgi:hypothetical protein
LDIGRRLLLANAQVAALRVAGMRAYAVSSFAHVLHDVRMRVAGLSGFGVASSRYARGPCSSLRHPIPSFAGALFRASARYILSIIAWPKPEHDTCVAPGISRAKS